MQQARFHGSGDWLEVGALATLTGNSSFHSCSGGTCALPARRCERPRSGMARWNTHHGLRGAEGVPEDPRGEVRLC